MKTAPQSNLKAEIARRTIFDTPIVVDVLRGFCLCLLKVLGWRRVGQVPDEPKCLYIGAPHTSNWDAVIGLAIAFAFRIKVFWMGKSDMFRWPFGVFFRWLGGIAIDRHQRHNLVSQAIQAFRENAVISLAILPEGTRSRVRRWKTGFYHIAMGAKVPIVLAFVDYPSRIGGFGPIIRLTGDMQADLARIGAFYADKTGKRPELTGPVTF
ncbi:MAG: lysophospholipid acyltransferase family protein [Phycisphaerae bacterium]|nr:lysophospholipid acyltransferase family protein [Phycisphaerae bacterium]